ncbi:MAG: hypothetical protein HYY98_04895 [Burkholderiales bacterium]|nr:hypothetical protein [Burkholderiales bacterium]
MKSVWVCMALVGGSLWAGAASAQMTYHCRDSNGSNFVLARPCPSDMRTTAVVGGPAPSSSYSSSSGSYRPSSRSTGDEPEHLQYMGGRCRSLYQAMRTASSRGLKYDAIEDLRREYKRECSEEEESAYTRLSTDRYNRKKEQREEEKATRLADQASRDREDRFLQQCAESRRILQAKQARTDLSEGEKADLRRFEENFIARCKR